MNGITVLVDADACPVVKSVERIAKSHNVPVVLLCDTNHVLKSDYSEIKIIGAGVWRLKKYLYFCGLKFSRGISITTF